MDGLIAIEPNVQSRQLAGIDFQLVHHLEYPREPAHNTHGRQLVRIQIENQPAPT